MKKIRVTDLAEYKARAFDHEARARAVADSLRNYLTAMNTGGIGVVFAIAGTLIERGVDPRWAFWPVIFYVLGILLTGLSLALAKHRELKRRDAALQWKSLLTSRASLAKLHLGLLFIGWFILGSGYALWYLLRVDIVCG